MEDYFKFCSQECGNDDETGDFFEIAKVCDNNGEPVDLQRTTKICNNNVNITRNLTRHKRKASQNTVSSGDEEYRCPDSYNDIVEVRKEVSSFDNLFYGCTEWAKGDGNCFIWSALNLLDRDSNFKNMLNLRSELQTTFDKMLNNQEYKEKYGAYVSEGYKGLEKSGEYVEINPGIASLAKYTSSKVVAFSKTSRYNKTGQSRTEFAFVMANENGELLFDCNLEQIKSKVITDNIKTIVLREGHYQPLKRDYNSRNDFLKGFFRLFIDQTYSEIKKNIKETHESKEESLLNNIRVLLPNNGDTDILYAEVIDIKTNIRNEAEKEKKLYSILDRVYEKTKELYTGQSKKVLEEPTSTNENKKIDEFAKKLCDQDGSIVESNMGSCNKKNFDVDLNSVLDDPNISPEDKEEILNSFIDRGEKEKKPKSDKNAKGQTFGDYYDLY